MSINNELFEERIKSKIHECVEFGRATKKDGDYCAGNHDKWHIILHLVAHELGLHSKVREAKNINELRNILDEVFEINEHDVSVRYRRLRFDLIRDLLDVTGYNSLSDLSNPRSLLNPANDTYYITPLQFDTCIVNFLDEINRNYVVYKSALKNRPQIAEGTIEYNLQNQIHSFGVFTGLTSKGGLEIKQKNKRTDEHINPRKLIVNKIFDKIERDGYPSIFWLGLFMCDKMQIVHTNSQENTDLVKFQNRSNWNKFWPEGNWVNNYDWKVAYVASGLDVLYDEEGNAIDLKDSFSKDELLQIEKFKEDITGKVNRGSLNVTELFTPIVQTFIESETDVVYGVFTSTEELYNEFCQYPPYLEMDEELHKTTFSRIVNTCFSELKKVRKNGVCGYKNLKRTG